MAIIIESGENQKMMSNENAYLLAAIAVLYFYINHIPVNLTTRMRKIIGPNAKS